MSGSLEEFLKADAAQKAIEDGQILRDHALSERRYILNRALIRYSS